MCCMILGWRCHAKLEKSPVPQGQMQTGPEDLMESNMSQSQQWHAILGTKSTFAELHGVHGPASRLAEGLTPGSTPGRHWVFFRFITA